MSWYARQQDRLRFLWRKLRDEHASPSAIAQAIALGVFVGCTPALGFHGPLAVGGALLFKKNKLWTWLGSRISNILVLPWIAIAEIELAHRLRTGDWVSLTRDTVFDRAPLLLVDWVLGTIPIGLALGAVFGLGAYAVAEVVEKRRVSRARKLARPRPPTSESVP